MTLVRIVLICFIVSLMITSPVFAEPQPGLWNIDEESNGQPGRGFQIDTQGNVLIMTFYGYESNGRPTFYLSSGQFEDDRYEGELLTFIGGTTLGGVFVDAEVSDSAGDVILQFDSTTTGTIRLPGEEEKAISRYSYADISQQINGTYEGDTAGIGPFSTDSSTYTLRLDNGAFTLIRDSFFSGECRFEGIYVLAGIGVEASGDYRCADFSEGEFVAEQVSVNNIGVYSALLTRFPDDSSSPIREKHSGL